MMPGRPLLALAVLAALLSPAHARFDWGTGCEAGQGKFKQPVAENGVLKVGDIPKGKTDVEIELRSDKDVDIRLYDLNKEIVAWPKGILSGSKQGSTSYAGVVITYSGYNGGQTTATIGHEFIRFKGTTDRNLVMKVFGYAAGTAEVNYKWAAQDRKSVV